MTVIEPHPASYRDPSGFIFTKTGITYRQVNEHYARDYDVLINSGLFKLLVDKNMMIAHDEVPDQSESIPPIYKIIRPEQLQFINYPYEWCFSQLKDAAILTLEILDTAVDHGMILKDATGFNIIFRNSKPVFIDTLSFEIYDESRPWVAYRQFCENFLAPLVLSAKIDPGMIRLLQVYPDGIPIRLCSSLLPISTRLNSLTGLHIHLQARIEKTAKGNKPVTFNKQKIKRIIDHLRSGIHALQGKEHISAWSDYYEKSILQDEYLKYKEELVPAILNEIPFQSVLDMGSNTGQFAVMLSRMGKSVIAIDNDSVCIDRLYTYCKHHNTNVTALVIDILNPTPSIGWNNSERNDIRSRLKPDLILALALIHHLSIARNLPLGYIAKGFADLCTYLLIEYVPTNDEKVQQMIMNKTNFITSYSEENFKTSFEVYFRFEKELSVGRSGRKLFLLKKKISLLE